MKLWRSALVGVSVAVLGVSPVAAQSSAANKSLYERLGGMPAITAVTSGLVDRILADSRISFGVTESDQHALTTSIRQLDEVFLLVVVGEFNSGKSAFINALIDWLVDQDCRQWQVIASRLVERTREHERMLGAPEVGSFHVDRSRVADSVGREAQRVVDTYDKRREAMAIADYARSAVTTAAAAGGAAVGLGTLVTIAASTAAADVTGIAMAGVIATLGFLVFPARRRRAKREMQVKITDLRQRLASALRTEFERAQEQSATRIAHAVDPYSRFVRAEHERWQQAHSRLTELSDQASALVHNLAA